MADDVVIERPNRGKASSKASRAVIILLLLASVVLFLIVMIGGWDALVGAQIMAIFYVVVYLIMAFYVARWNRGVLPVAAALAIIMAIFAAAAVPGWIDRDDTGFQQPAIDAGVLGLVTALLIPVQVLLIVFSLRAFNQA